MRPNKQQKRIVALLKGGSNVLTQAEPGAGKTTTALMVCKEFKRVLLLTYSSSLKSETRTRVRAMPGIVHNVVVHSFHSAAQQFYKSDCHNDAHLRQLLDSGKRMFFEHEFDLVVVDEAQDLKPQLHELTMRIRRDLAASCQWLVVGDVDQAIYGYQGADARFLTRADDDRVFPSNGHTWEHGPLSPSQRLTFETANFLNECVYHEEKVHGVRHGPKPIFLRCNAFSDVARVVLPLLKGYSVDEIAILAPSVNGNTPMRRLENALVRQGYTCFVPNSDDETSSADVLKGKLRLLTYHQSKGLTRRVVVAFSCDGSYFEFYNRSADRSRVANPQHVAFTRASELMVLVQHSSMPPLSFMSPPDKLRQYCDYRDLRPRDKEVTFNVPHSRMTVTNLLRHLTDEEVEHALSFLAVDIVRERGELISLPTTTKQRRGVENVACINGIFVAMMLQYRRQHRCDALSDLQTNLRDNAVATRILSKDEKNRVLALNPTNLTKEEMIYVAITQMCVDNGYLHPIAQIRSFDWLDDDDVDRLVDRLDALVPLAASEYESSKEAHVRGIDVVGRCDVIGPAAIYELKCRNGGITSDDLLQVAMYGHLARRDRGLYVINANDDSVSEVGPKRPDDLKRLVEYLVGLKNDDTDMNDDLFFEMCASHV